MNKPRRGAGETSGITLEFTREELSLLATLASDQLFRWEFIDPKMPGHVAKQLEISSARALVARLRGALDPNSVKPTSSSTRMVG